MTESSPNVSMCAYLRTEAELREVAAQGRPADYTADVLLSEALVLRAAAIVLEEL